MSPASLLNVSLLLISHAVKVNPYHLLKPLFLMNIVRSTLKTSSIFLEMRYRGVLRKTWLQFGAKFENDAHSGFIFAITSIRFRVSFKGLLLRDWAFPVTYPLPIFTNLQSNLHKSMSYCNTSWVEFSFLLEFTFAHSAFNLSQVHRSV